MPGLRRVAEPDGPGSLGCDASPRHVQAGAQPAGPPATSSRKASQYRATTVSLSVVKRLPMASIALA